MSYTFLILWDVKAQHCLKKLKTASTLYFIKACNANAIQWFRAHFCCLSEYSRHCLIWGPSNNVNKRYQTHPMSWARSRWQDSSYTISYRASSGRDSANSNETSDDYSRASGCRANGQVAVSSTGSGARTTLLAQLFFTSPRFCGTPRLKIPLSGASDT